MGAEPRIGRGSPEQVIQRAVCQHLRQRGASGELWFSERRSAPPYRGPVCLRVTGW